MDELEVLQDNPLRMAEATLINNDDEEHVIIHTLTYSKTRCLLMSPQFHSLSKFTQIPNLSSKKFQDI